MEYRYIPMEQYARREHFEYFKGLAYPYVGVTVNVEITDWLAAVKKRQLPFFHSFLYAAANAANGVREFRQRIEGDGIIEFEKCLSSYTVALEDETYCYCTLDTSKPFGEFLGYAKEEQRKAVEEKNLTDGEDSLSFFFISSLPWLSYHTIIQPVPMPADSNPRITWGKYFAQGEKIFIPVSLLCHHALVDGIHISKFYEQLQKELSAMIAL